MAVPIVILHGYGGRPEDWETMGGRLVDHHGGQVTHVFLGQFVSKEDDLVYGDLSEGLDRELKKHAARLGNLAPRSFSIIAHSTGALVVRQWLQRYYGDAPDRVPLQHLILLAPANFGSRLAHHGNAEYGRFLNFLEERTWEGWETGRNILDGLELASPFTWDLAMGDILKSGAGRNPYVLNADGFYTFVIIGNQPHTGRIEKRFPARAEPGSDGTVRVAAAALNSRRLNIDFTRKPPGFSPTDGYSVVPLAVVPGVDHSNVKTDECVFDLVVEALQVDSDDSFGNTIEHFGQITRDTLRGDKDDPLTHEYQQFVVRVVDDTDTPVQDYDFDFEVFEIHDRQLREDPDLTDAFNETKRHIHTYTKDPSYRCFFIDYTELQTLAGRLAPGHGVFLSMIARDISNKVHYETSDATRIPLWGPVALTHLNLFAGSTTTLVNITLDRRARGDLFAFRPYPG